MTPEQKERIVRMIAEGVAKKALRIEWEDTESQARIIAWSAAEALFELAQKAAAVNNAVSRDDHRVATDNLVTFILGEVDSGQAQL